MITLLKFLVLFPSPTYPVILSNISTIFHGSPAGPSLDAVDAGVPDALAPDDVLEVEGAAVVHGPLGELAARHGRDAAAVGAHEVDSLAAAVVGCAGAGAVSGAINLPDPSGPSSDKSLCAVDGNSLARSDGRERGSRVPAESGGSRGAALHLRRAGAETRHGCATAVALPAAVSRRPVGAGRLAAALDVGRIGRAGTADGHAASRRAGRCRKADTWVGQSAMGSTFSTGIIIINQLGHTSTTAGTNAWLVSGRHDVGGRGEEESESCELHFELSGLEAGLEELTGL